MSKIKGFFKKYLSTSDSLTLKEELGYCGGIFGNTMGQDSVHTYGDKFSRNFMGVEPIDIQKKDNIVEIISFFIPPLAGALYDTDRGKGKMSYVRMAIGSAPIPFAIASMLLFIVPFAQSDKNFFWVLAFNLLFTIADNFFDMSMTTLGLRMTPNASDRKNFFTLSSIASTLGSMLPGWVIPIIVGMTDDPHKKQWLYFFIALVFCVIGFAAMFGCFVAVKDKPVVSLGLKDEEEEKIHWNKDIIKAILHNRPFIVTQISTITDTVRQITYSFLPYLYEDTFDDYGMKAIIDAISGLFSYLGLFAVPVVGNKISARNILAGGYGYTAFFYALMSLFNFKFNLDNIRKKRYIIGILIGLAGMPNAAQGAARRIIVADSTDYMEWYSAEKLGKPLRSDGILSAAQSIFGKVVSLVKTNGYNICMRAIKYKSTNSARGEVNIQSNDTLRGIFRVISLCGLVGNILSAVCFLFDSYDGERKEQIQSRLSEIRQKKDEKLDEYMN